MQSEKFIRLGALHPSRGNEVMIVYANPIIPVIRRADQLFRRIPCGSVSVPRMNQFNVPLKYHNVASWTVHNT